MVALSKLDVAVLLASAGGCKEGVGEGLAVLDVDEADADARLVAMAKNLQSWIQFASAANANLLFARENLRSRIQLNQHLIQGQNLTLLDLVNQLLIQ